MQYPSLVLAALTAVPVAAAQYPTTRQAPAHTSDIAQAVAALPPEHRAGAEVWQVRDGAAHQLRAGTNGFVCLADEPGNDVFFVICGSAGYASRIKAQIAQATGGTASPLPDLAPGTSKADLFGRRGPDGSLPDTLRYDVTIYFPNEAAANMAMPSADAALDEVGMTFMSAGRPSAHVHIRRWVATAELLGG